MCKEYYCGFNFLPNYIKKRLSNDFNLDCKKHDINYKPESNYTRKEADKIFLDDMLKNCNNSKRLKLVAYTYYFLVRCFGFITYKKDYNHE